jgi:N4-bis(aminopropyl)spermidine synthase
MPHSDQLRLEGGGVSVVADVAGAVGLAEGEAGVRDVLRVVARRGPVAVRKVSRATELPVPIVSAICNELRKHGVIAPERPVRLTSRGRALMGAIRAGWLELTCGTCGGAGIAIPPELEQTMRELRRLADRAPRARVELDQSHCTVETKLRRVLALHEAGALEGRAILLLGDDDLISLAIRLVVAEFGLHPPARLVVLDVDPAVAGFIRRRLEGAPLDADIRVHDLRELLPKDVRRTADVVFTDPPYTVQGATLFLSRAAEAVTTGADVFLSFGPKRPLEALELQRALAAMGFTIRELRRNFNEYVGAGVLAGRSHLYRLAATSQLTPVVGRYDGPLYTRELGRNAAA